MNLVIHLIGTLVFLVWLFCLVGWIRRGVRIPRYLHILATVLGAGGIALLIALAVSGVLSAKLVALCLLPVPAVYFGWFWMFGPEWQGGAKETENGEQR